MLVITLFLCICRSSCCLRPSRVPSVVIIAVFIYRQHTQNHTCCMICSTRIRLVLRTQSCPSHVPAGAPKTGLECNYEQSHVYDNDTFILCVINVTFTTNGFTYKHTFCHRYAKWTVRGALRRSVDTSESLLQQHVCSRLYRPIVDVHTPYELQNNSIKD